MCEVLVRYLRHKSAICVLWLPIISVSGLSCVGILGMFTGCHSRSYGDLTNLGFVLDAFFVWPWFVVFAGAILLRPIFSKQSAYAWVVGVAVTASMVTALVVKADYQESVKFIVLDSEGRCLPKIQLIKRFTRHGNPENAEYIQTDSYGAFKMRLPPGESIFIEAEDPYIGTLEIWNQPHFLPGTESQNLKATCYWDNRVANEFGGGRFPVFIKPGQKEPVTFVLKTREQAWSKMIHGLISNKLMEMRNDGGINSDGISELISNPESVDQMDLIAEVMMRQAKLRPQLISGLQWMGKFVSGMDRIANSKFPRHEESSMRAYYLQYAGIAPSIFADENNLLKKEADKLANQLISLLEPYFASDDGAAHVVEEMEVAGHRVLPIYADVFFSANSRCQDAMIRTFWIIRATSKDINWLTESGNPHFVIAGYAAVDDNILPEDRLLAKQRIDQALAKTADPQDQYLGKLLQTKLGPVSE